MKLEMNLDIKRKRQICTGNCTLESLPCVLGLELYLGMLFPHSRTEHRIDTLRKLPVDTLEWPEGKKYTKYFNNWGQTCLSLRLTFLAIKKLCTVHLSRPCYSKNHLRILTHVMYWKPYLNVCNHFLINENITARWHDATALRKPARTEIT